MFRRPSIERSRDGLDGRPLRHHPDLDGIDVEIAEHRIDLRGHEFCRHVMDAGNTICVLRGQGRDRGGAIDAERRKRLQIGLDAGATRRIRAGDGERDRRRHHSARKRFSDPEKGQCPVVARPAIGSKFACHDARFFALLALTRRLRR
jgi:hypothetical protein